MAHDRPVPLDQCIAYLRYRFEDPEVQRRGHILPRITPNISAHTIERINPLAEYLDSLGKVRDLPVDEIMPAHEWRFRGLADRADDIAAHHERRLAELLAAIAAHPNAPPET